MISLVAGAPFEVGAPAGIITEADISRSLFKREEQSARPAFLWLFVGVFLKAGQKGESDPQLLGHYRPIS